MHVSENQNTRKKGTMLPGFTANKATLLIKFADKRHISMGDG
jgi:hypothetical protein